MYTQYFLVDENWTRKFESYAMNKLQGGNLHKEAVSFKSNSDNYIHRNIPILHTIIISIA